MLGLSERLLQRVKFRLHGPARKGRQLVGKALVRNMGAMRSVKGVIHVQIAQCCHSIDHYRILFLLAREYESLLQQRHSAIAQSSDGSFRFIASATWYEYHRPGHERVRAGLR